MGTISMQHFIYNSPFHDDWDSKFARSTGSYPFLNDVEAPEDARTPKVYPESGNVINKNPSPRSGGRSSFNRSFHSNDSVGRFSLIGRTSYLKVVNCREIVNARHAAVHQTEEKILVIFSRVL